RQPRRRLRSGLGDPRQSRSAIWRAARRTAQSVIARCAGPAEHTNWLRARPDCGDAVMTGRALMNPQGRERLCRRLGMLVSDTDGKDAAAGREERANIKRLDLTWDDVVCSPPESWRHMAATCARQAHMLNTRGRDFITNVMRLRWLPSDRQLSWLES